MNLSCTFCGNPNPEGSFTCQRCGRTLQPSSSGAPGSFGAPSWGQDPSSYPPAAYPPAVPPAGFGAPSPPQAPYPGSPQSSYPGSGYTPGSTNPNQGAWQNPAFPVAGMAPMVSPEQKSAKQMAVAGMICSIAALVVGWCCSIGFILGPVGVVLGFISRSKLNSINSRDGMGMAFVAIGLGLFATLLPILFLLVIFIIGALNPQ